MNKNKEYRLKRKVQRKDYIIQDKNLTIKTLYCRNETKRNKIEQLQQENQQLKEKINTYENPEDLTLMFMYCDEKAKDKIKQLKERITYLENSNNRREETIISLRNEQQLD